MHEKMHILKMLEEGKITADEAARLIEALSKGSDDMATARPSAPAQPATPPRQTATGGGYSSPTSGGGYGSSNANNGRPTSGSGSPVGFDDFASELGKKFETLAKDFEPKLQKFTEIVVEKTAGMADMISKSISESPRSTAASPSTHQSGSHSSAPSGAATSGTEKSFEALVLSGPNELNISGLNAPVVLKGYNGDKITMKVRIRARRHGAEPQLMKLGNKYSLNYNEDDFESVYIDAYVPAAMFYSVNVRTTNGVLDVSGIKAEYLSLANSGGETVIGNLEFSNLKVECNNGQLTLQKLDGKNAHIENFNGDLTVNSPDVANLKLSSFNGGIYMTVPHFDLYSEYIWVVETSNAGVNLNLPAFPGLGYLIKAHTSLNDIKLGLTGLNYLMNDKTNLEAKSINYDVATKHVKISLETSNAPITVN